MGEVAITTIVHDGKVINAGSDVNRKGMTDEQYQALVSAGAIGDESLIRVAAQSTAATLQSPEAVAPEYTSPLAVTGAPSEEEVATALRIRTDQVSRAEGKDVAKVATDEAETIAKAEAKGNEASAKEAAKNAPARTTAAIPGTAGPAPQTETVTKVTK